MPEKFKAAPYNYCDYRCDRCDEQDHCRVFKEDQERLLEHYTKGEDPYDPQIFVKDLKGIFQKTENMLKDVAEKEGIDLNQMPGEETEIAAPEIKPEEFVIYRLAFEYSRQARAFIKQLEHDGVPEIVREDFSDVVWYHTLIAAKTGRLVSGFIDDFRDEETQKMEEDGTRSVIQKCIDLSRNGLQHMLNELPDHFYTITDLLDLISKIERQVQTDVRKKVG
jgi:hypothetical protein